MTKTEKTTKILDPLHSETEKSKKKKKQSEKKLGISEISRPDRDFF